MKHTACILFLTLAHQSGFNKKENLNRLNYIEENVPGERPLEFKPHLTPAGMIIHRGVFAPDYQEYYYTLSDNQFNQFDVKVIKKTQEGWSEPEDAFFNTEYNEHGMSFSPDGEYLYFSSTRPVASPLGLPQTWHIWRARKMDGLWTDPEFVEIPNLREKLLSHPSVTYSGKLYFQASNLDYSDMHIYEATPKNGMFGVASKVKVPGYENANECTPFIAPDDSYLLFAIVKEGIHLVITIRALDGQWQEPTQFGDLINTNNQGNPYVSPDGEFLFYATGEHSVDQGAFNWKMNWVNMDEIDTFKLGFRAVK